MIAVLGFGFFDLDADGVTEGASEDEAPAVRLRMAGTYDDPILISDNVSTLR